MKSKIIKWSIISVGIVIACFFALGIHLYYVTDNFYQNYRNPTEPQIQLSRIDFNEPIDSVDAKKIQSVVNNSQGIQKSYFNLKDNILVYAYYVGTQSSENIFNTVMASGNYSAHRFIATKSAIATGCPVMNGDKSTKGLLLVYQKIFSIF